MVLSQAQKNKIKTIKARYEGEGMREVHGRDGVWRPKIVGEVLKGVYLRVEANADNWNRNKYFFDDKCQTKDQDGQPIALKGEIAVFGSVVFDDKMSRIPTGADVAIIYCGEKANLGKKNPTKLFDIMSKKIIKPSEESNPKPRPEMKQVDKPAARELIRDCVTFLQDDGNYDPTPKDIMKYAEKLVKDGDDQDPQLLKDVESILDEKEKARKKREGS
jgi:hypothetical protein